MDPRLLRQVIQGIIDPSSRSYIDGVDASNCVFEQSGRGNNWAWGFNIGRQHRKAATPLSQRAMNLIRRRVRWVSLQAGPLPYHHARCRFNRWTVWLVRPEWWCVYQAYSITCVWSDGAR